MYYQWDDDKRHKNIQKHKLDFANIYLFQWDTALFGEDTRYEYDEIREIAYGRFNGYVTVVIFTERNLAYRIISWRRATKQETTWYEKHVNA